VKERKEYLDGFVRMQDDNDNNPWVFKIINDARKTVRQDA